MTTIRIRTEQVRRAGNQLQEAGKQLGTIGAELQRACRHLDTWAWDGRSRARIEPRFDQLQRENAHVREQLEHLGTVLVRIAEVFEVEDGQAAQKLAEMPWVDFGLGAAAVPIIAARGIFDSIWRGFEEIGEYVRNIFNPPEIEEGVDWLKNTEAGKQLIEDAQRAGIGFRLPDGQIIGDPNGRIIPINFGDTGSVLTGGLYRPDPDNNPETDEQDIVIADDFLNRYGTTKAGLANTIAHEMQHALDDKLGLKPGIDLGKYFTEVEGKQTLGDSQQLEQDISTYIRHRVASEVRAFERGDSVEYQNAYEDDGVLTADEVRSIMEKRPYQSRYEEQLNEHLNDYGYEVDLWVDDQGNIQTSVQPLQES